MGGTGSGGMELRMRTARAGCTLGVAVLCGVVGVIAGTVPGVLLAQEPGSAQAILSASERLADEMPRDVVRLALQVAIVAILALVASIGAMYKLVVKQAAKPCLMNTEDGQAIMRDSHQRAMEKAHVEYLKSRQEGDD